MKVLVTGVKGQLGYDVVKELERLGHNAIGVDIEEMDITKKYSVEATFALHKPEAVIHCAAYTAVDAAEDHIDLCREINATGTKYIAEHCKQYQAKMLYLSTDYVFDGEGSKEWLPDDQRNPLNIYGQTKYEGEVFVEELLENYFIVRISWVFGINGKNFIKTMLELGKTRDKLTVVDDQIGSPTYTYDLAKLLVSMIQTNQYGTYHASNEGLCSWYEFAVEIFKQAGLTHIEVSPVPASTYPTKAKRPSNSRMSKGKLLQNGFELLPPWQDALSRYLKEL